MASNLLDFKKFKHVKTDDKSTTLRHKDGHLLTLAHNVLSPKNQEMLKALSKVGEENQTEGQKQEEQDKSQYGKVIQKAKGGAVKMADGGGLPSMDDLDQLIQQKFGQASSQAVKNVQMKLGLSEDAAKAQLVKMFQAPPPVRQQMVPGALQAPAPSPESAEFLNPKIRQQAAPSDQVSQQAALAQAPEAAKAMNDKLNAQAAQDQAAENAFNKSQDEFDPSQYKPYVPKAKGGEIKKYAKGGGEGQPAEISLEELNKQLANIPDQAPDLPAPQKAEAPDVGSILESGKQYLMQPAGSPYPTEAAAQQSEPEEAPAPTPQQAPIAEAPAQEAPKQGGMPDIGTLANTAYSQGMGAINKQEEAAKLKAEADIVAQDKRVNDASQALAAFQQGANEINQERKAHIADIQNGYVDPNKYWAGYTAPNGDYVPGHSKIAAGIGMILAGFNPTGRPNAAIDVLKSQMEQSLHAQAQNLDSQHNLLRANLEHFRNYQQAADMTRVMMNDSLQHQLDLAAAKAATPQAQAAAMAAKSQLAQSIIPLAMNIQMRNAMTHLTGNGPQGNGQQNPGANRQFLGMLQVQNPEMYKEQVAKLSPDGYFADKPIAEPVKEQMLATAQFEQAAKEYQQFAQQHSGDKRPAVISQGKVMAANLQNLYRQSIHGGVFKQGEQGFIENIIPSDPTQFFGGLRTIPKISELIHENNNALNMVRKGYNLPPIPGTAVPMKQDMNAAKAWLANPQNKSNPHYESVKRLVGQ